MNKQKEVKTITNKEGKVVARIHGEMNIDLLANFFLKTLPPNVTIKG